MGANGKIITFYSYKGGTGRSMALANVAWILALAGKRVLMIDWDLEAPGLHRYFWPFLRDPALTQSDGLIDFVSDFASRASQEPDLEKQPDEWFRDRADLIRVLQPVKHDFGAGCLHFIAAGRQGPSYPVLVNSFNWKQFYEKLSGRRFFDAAKSLMRDEYEYILIDSRTGVSDTSGICTVHMPDTLVVCFTLNSQSIDGASEVAGSILEQRSNDERFRIFPVPSRVELSEKEKRDIAIDQVREKFGRLLGHVAPEKHDAYWGEAQMAYVPFYAFEEIPAVFGDEPQDPNALIASLQRIAGWVTEDKVKALPPVSRSARLELKERFSRTKADRPPETQKPQEAPERSRTVQWVLRSAPALVVVMLCASLGWWLWSRSTAQQIATARNYQVPAVRLAQPSDILDGYQEWLKGLVYSQLEPEALTKAEVFTDPGVKAVAIAAVADALWNMGKTGDATARFDRALEVAMQSKDHSSTLRILNTGTKIAARKTVETFKSIADDDEEYAQLANAYESAGLPDQAAILWRALAKERREPDAFSGLYRTAGRAAALQALDGAVLDADEERNIRCQIADAAIERKDNDPWSLASEARHDAIKIDVYKCICSTYADSPVAFNPPGAIEKELRQLASQCLLPNPPPGTPDFCRSLARFYGRLGNPSAGLAIAHNDQPAKAAVATGLFLNQKFAKTASLKDAALEIAQGLSGNDLDRVLYTAILSGFWKDALPLIPKASDPNRLFQAAAEAAHDVSLLAGVPNPSSIDEQLALARTLVQLESPARAKLLVGQAAAQIENGPEQRRSIDYRIAAELYARIHEYRLAREIADRSGVYVPERLYIFGAMLREYAKEHDAGLRQRLDAAEPPR